MNCKEHVCWQAGSAGPTVTSERQDDAEALIVAETEVAIEEPYNRKPPEGCILTSREGSSLLTASWVMRESRQAPRKDQLGRIEECKGYKSALDVLHELSARQPAEKSARRTAHGSNRALPSPLIMEHHHVHRHRHRHHRQARVGFPCYSRLTRQLWAGQGVGRGGDAGGAEGAQTFSVRGDDPARTLISSYSHDRVNLVTVVKVRYNH